ncbi:ATP-binding protein [Fulvivirgaceae bacterium BMA10]|uniref:histidine kinase n=1 Tax=Splendidivirga corallicola TaxID=3051826 RepID=A0ABT8KHI3_9BACT|nr:ATP-binding protein [Fulvivirgaceae bacterium BMA10]
MKVVGKQNEPSTSILKKEATEQDSYKSGVKTPIKDSEDIALDARFVKRDLPELIEKYGAPEIKTLQPSLDNLSKKELIYLNQNLLKKIAGLNDTNEQLDHRLKEMCTHIENLETQNKELDSFTYSVAHDLKAPLRGVSGFATILREDHSENLDSDGLRIVNIIKSKAYEMQVLINDLLSFSHISEKRFENGVINMDSLVEKIVTELSTNLRGRKIKIKIGKLPKVFADITMVKQLMVNLISNAVKFTGKTKYPKIEIGGSTQHDKHVFFIKDNGVGFDMNRADKLFHAFQRLHNKDEFEGTGIGLALVSRIVKRYGGEVWAQGEINKGATFYFSLPSKVDQD